MQIESFNNIVFVIKCLFYFRCMQVPVRQPIHDIDCIFCPPNCDALWATIPTKKLVPKKMPPVAPAQCINVKTGLSVEYPGHHGSCNCRVANRSRQSQTANVVWVMRNWHRLYVLCCMEVAVKGLRRVCENWRLKSK